MGNTEKRMVGDRVPSRHRELQEGKHSGEGVSESYNRTVLLCELTDVLLSAIYNTFLFICFKKDPVHR